MRIPPFLIPAAASAAGVLAGNALHEPVYAIIPLAAGTAIALWITFASHSPSAALKLSRLHYIWIALVFLSAGYTSASFSCPFEFGHEGNIGYRRAAGEITRIDTKAEYDRLFIDISLLEDSCGNVTNPQNLTVIVTTDGCMLNVGDIVEIPAQFKRITDPVKASSSGYADYMRHKGILYREHVYVDKIKLTGTRTSLRSLSCKCRNRVESLIEKSSLGDSAKRLVIALVCGDRSFMSIATVENFSDAGVSHVLAVSGLHVGIVAIAVLWCLTPMGLTRFSRIRYPLAALFVWIFVFISGGSISSVRAAIMTTSAFLTLSMQRKNNALNSLLGAAFIIILLWPKSIYDIGAQMSFMCVACLILFADAANPVDHHTHPRLHAIAALTVSSIVATAGTWSLAAYHFNRLPLMFLPVNMIILPVMPALMACSLTYVALLATGTDFMPLSYAITGVINIMEKVAGYIASSPGAAVYMEAGGLSVLLWTASLAVLAWGIHIKKSRILCVSTLPLMVLAVILAHV